MTKNECYAVVGTKYGRRKALRKFSQKKYAVRYKNLIKVTGATYPGKHIYKNLRVKKVC